MSTICLNMIVRNEAEVIVRCLDALAPHIHSWVIMDTGSTDGTQELVRERLKHLPGELFERPWSNFGQARTEALERVGGRADYILVMDADDTLVCPEGYAFPDLAADAYAVQLRLGSYAYSRICLVSTRLAWRYEGVLHEHLATDGPFQPVRLNELHIAASTQGGRSADPQKYLKDARVLEQELARAPGHSRNVFYLAQSYLDAGLEEKSLAAYRARAAMGGWEEEVWWSLYQMAGIMERLGRPDGAIIKAYLDAYQRRPTRAESLCALARFMRLKGDCHSACLFAEQACALPRPDDTLFLDESVYAWRSLDEFSVAAYWIGREAESEQACSRLLAGTALPEPERPRVVANWRFARQALEARCPSAPDAARPRWSASASPRCARASRTG